MKLERSQIEKLENFLEKIKSETYPEPSSPIHTKITRQMFAKFMKLFPLSPPAKILDIGCGQGVALELFQNQGFDPIGITLNSEDVAVCQQKGYEVYEMDQSFLDFPDASFDFVWCRHCIEHSIFPYFTLSEIYRVLKPQGFFYLEIPAPDTVCNHEANINHYSVLGKKMWKKLLHKSGFKVLKVLDIQFHTRLGMDTYWAMIQKKF